MWNIADFIVVLESTVRSIRIDPLGFEDCAIMYVHMKYGGIFTKMRIFSAEYDRSH